MTARPLDTDDVLAIVRALVNLNATDLLYADQYLRRAEVLLPKECTREQHDQWNLPRLTQELRQAADHGDWVQVRNLAQQAAHARECLVANQSLLQLADAAYGPRVVHADARPAQTRTHTRRRRRIVRLPLHGDGLNADTGEPWRTFRESPRRCARWPPNDGSPTAA